MSDTNKMPREQERLMDQPLERLLAAALRADEQADVSAYVRASAWEAARRPADEEFLHRAQQAAIAAAALVRMRREQERLGFVPLPLAVLIRRLATQAQASVEAVCRWAGLDDLEALTVKSIRGVAKLTKALGINLREVLVHARLSLLEQDRPYAVATCCSGQMMPASAASVEKCGELLRVAEASLPRSARRRTQAVLNAIEQAYSQE